ncbi:MAG: HNH endonuclease [Lachnospiraceae bacterium]|nr:HNH endonuclease [Lachnospiraceae bacterium]
MIKVERKLTDKAQKAIASLLKAKTQNSTYNTPEVNAALREMFHSKCYICESNQITSYQIEHLRSHKGDVELKYNWNNLFLACAHCNNTKLNKYEPIVDCTKENVEELITFRKKGYFGTEEELIFEVLDERLEIQNTAKLLREVYYGSTPQKQMEAKKLRRTLRKELSQFKEYVREYQEAEDEDQEDLKYLLKKQLEDTSPFAAFKRWLIKDNQEFYPELAAYIKSGRK